VIINVHEPLIINLQQLEILITTWDSHCHLFKAISDSDSIQVLKITYDHKAYVFYNDFLKYMRSQLKELVVSFLIRKVGSHITLRLLGSLIGGTSAKKLTITGWLRPITLLELQELLTKLPDTLEELTISIPLRRNESLQQIDFDETVQKINQLRSTKGVSIPFKVKIGYEKFEGIY